MAAALAAALALYAVVERQGASGTPLALLRWVAWGTVAALLLNPALRRLGSAEPTVLLDGSLSMTDPVGDARWRAALDSATRLCDAGCVRRGRLLVFGRQARVYRDSARPEASASVLLPALREAAARGGPIVIITDGVIDDAGSLPTDLLRRARVLIVPAPARPDAGVAAFEVPPALRSGDSARVSVDVAFTGAGAGDSVLIELLEDGRVMARSRAALGAGGVRRVELAFLPAAVRGDREVRRYTARLSGFARDAEPRDDERSSAAAVTRGATVALLSDSPDWDFRWAAQALVATSGVPVRALVRPSPAGPWRDARTLRPVQDGEMRQEASRATLVLAHGTPETIALLRRLARGSLIEWPTTRTGGAGDWYVAASEFASPIGGAMASVPVESLPPLESAGEGSTDSVAWTGILVQQDRRGRSRPVVQGMQRGGRRAVLISGAGFWRWASRGGAAAEGYRALMASLADWLMDEEAHAPAQLLALRDSLSGGIAEFLPRPATLAPQAGLASEASGEPVPLRHSAWLYFVALGALVMEWVMRRRRGLR
jgi:hypothetical protein